MRSIVMNDSKGTTDKIKLPLSAHCAGQREQRPRKLETFGQIVSTGVFT